MDHFQKTKMNGASKPRFAKKTKQRTSHQKKRNNNILILFDLVDNKDE